MEVFSTNQYAFAFYASAGIKIYNITPDVLHIDVQGAEYYVISSLGEYRPTLIYLETSETEHYKGSKSVADLNLLLTDIGYELVETLQYDSLYKKK